MVLCYQLVKKIYTIFLGDDFSHFLFDLHTISITIRDENCKYNNTNYIVHLFFLHHQNYSLISSVTKSFTLFSFKLKNLSKTLKDDL